MPHLAIIQPQLSPARTRLADAIAEHDRAVKAAPALSDAIARLDRAKADEAAALADIADLEAAEDGKLKAWALDPKGAAPALDVRRRAELDDRLATARGAAEVARRVETGLRSEHAAATKAIAAANAALDDAVVGVMSEDLEQDQQQLIADLAAINTRISQHFMAVGCVHSLPQSDQVRATAKRLEMPAENLMDRERLSFPDRSTFNGVDGMMRRYAERLRQDCRAALGDLK